MYQTTKIEVVETDELQLSREMVFSRMDLNPVQMDVISLLLAQIGKDEDEDMQRNYRLTSRDFAELKHYKDIDSAYNKLSKRIGEGGISRISFKIWRNEEDWEEYNWFTSVRYFNGTLMLHVNPEVKALLVALKKQDGYKMFASLQYVLPMKSYYSKRIYMMCRQYVSGGAIYKIDWDEFKQMLAIPKTYSNQQIEERVLRKAQEEIAQYTDLLIEYEFKTSRGMGRGGKKIDAISFSIKKKPKNLLEKKSSRKRLEELPEKQQHAIQMKKEGVQPDQQLGKQKDWGFEGQRKYTEEEIEEMLHV